jgi:hypothetical protein
MEHGCGNDYEDRAMTTHNHLTRRIQPQYPFIHIALAGQDGNAFAILGRCVRAMKRAKIPQSEITSFTNEATSGDYNNLLQTVMRYFYFDDPQVDGVENGFYVEPEAATINESVRERP